MSTMTTISIIIGVLMVSWLLMSSLIPPEPSDASSASSSATSSPAPINTASNLYRSSDVVTELTSEHQIRSQIISGTPTVVVFYAPWCGHCRQFVKPYEKLARTTLDMHRNVSFAAINCVTFNSVCTKAPFNVRAFPTMIGFNLEANSATGKEIDRHIAKAQAYIIAHSSISIEVPEKIPLLDSNSTAVSVLTSMKEYLQSKTSKPARVATSGLRLHDALTSLNWMLSTITAEQLEINKLGSLKRMLRTLVTLLPSCQKTEIKLYNSVLDILAKVENGSDESKSISSSAASEDIKKLIGSHGISAHSDSCLTKQEASERARAQLAGQPTSGWWVCAAPEPAGAAPHADSGTAASHIGASELDVSSGYTCGLWMLFHYMTVASAHRYSQISSLNTSDVPTALDTKNVIVSFVDQHFSCSLCRDNFMKVVDDCAFEGCQIKKYDYSHLQLWLFQAHDFATRRIVLEYHHMFCQAAATSAPASSELRVDVGERVQDSIGASNCFNEQQLAIAASVSMWPASKHCRDCKVMHTGVDGIVEEGNNRLVLSLLQEDSAKLWHKDQVGSFLLEAYWNAEWKLPASQVDSTFARGIASHSVWSIILIIVFINGTIFSLKTVLVATFEILHSQFGVLIRRKRSSSESKGEDSNA